MKPQNKIIEQESRQAGSRQATENTDANKTTPSTVPPGRPRFQPPVPSFVDPDKVHSKHSPLGYLPAAHPKSRLPFPAKIKATPRRGAKTQDRHRPHFPPPTHFPLRDRQTE
jgi:hypothetical protein